MTPNNITSQRLHNQHITGTLFKKPEEVVQWLGAVQAQDYAAAKWAVAQRTVNSTDADLDRLFAEGTILRTHVLRPTWHFVTPADIRWMLALTAPRVNALNAHYCRKLELDDALFARSNTALAKALQGENQLTRAELAGVLNQAGIATDNLRLVHFMMRAELDGIICSGARRGKQFTYALLDERAPQAKALEREEALAGLSRRYFMSRGPATLQDFVWWSGLTTNDARDGLEMIKSQLICEEGDGQTYWLPLSSTSLEDQPSPTAYLLPNYDEYVVGYTDRNAIIDASHTEKLDSRNNPLFQYIIVINGRIVGAWKRTLKKHSVVIELNPFTPLTEAESQAVAMAAQRYGAFLEMQPMCSV